MGNRKDCILTIDLSSLSIKVGLVSKDLDLISTVIKGHSSNIDDIDGFARSFNLDELWEKIILSLKDLIKKQNSNDLNIIGCSSDAQRMAFVFLDKDFNVIYGGPNLDLRGIDSAYIIEDEFTEEQLFKITARSPTLLFGLARLLWFKEEEEELYKKIRHFLSLDDWISFKLTGNIITDYTNAAEYQTFDIKKGEWNSEIIDAFNLDPDIFPEVIYSGSLIGNLKEKLIKQMGINELNIPVIKTGGDTQASLLGMGVREKGDIGISLGTTTPLHLVLNEPLIDSNLNFWTTYYSIKGKWLLEANTGKTGKAYDWFKDAFLDGADKNPDKVIEEYLKTVKPGAESTFAFLGPQFMDFKNQINIKRGVFIFQSPSAISEDLPKSAHFARALIENICFGIFENFNALNNYNDDPKRAFCAGRMANSKEFCKILVNIIDTEINFPKHKDSAFIGAAINTLVGLNHYSDEKSVIEENLEIETVRPEPTLSKEYQSIYQEWKTLKEKVDEL